MSVCYFKNIKWDSKYNDYWNYYGEGPDSTQFKNLQKCFSEVFGLQIQFKNEYTYCEAEVKEGIPQIRLSSAYGSEIQIINLEPGIPLRMRKEGSNNDGMREVWSNASGVASLEGSGAQHGGKVVTFYFGEIAIEQSVANLYLFNQQSIEKLNTQTFPYLKNAVKIVDGTATDSSRKAFSDTSDTLDAYKTISDNYESSSGVPITASTLQQLGVTIVEIPRYKLSIGNKEYHFEVLSFKENRVSMTEEEKGTGQFCHDGNLQLAASSKVDAKYWSSTPHVYPEVIFNNTTSTLYDLGVTFTINNGQLTVTNSEDNQFNKTWPLYPNDSIVFYIRKPATTVTIKDNKPTSYWNQTTLKESYYSKLPISHKIESYGTEVEFSSPTMKVWKWNHNSSDQINITTQKDSFINSNFTELNETDNKQFFNIIRTTNAEPTWRINQVADRLDDGGWWFQLGTYSGSTYSKPLEWTVSGIIKNIPYINDTPLTNHFNNPSIDIGTVNPSKAMKKNGGMEASITKATKDGCTSFFNCVICGRFEASRGIWPDFIPLLSSWSWGQIEYEVWGSWKDFLGHKCYSTDYNQCYYYSQLIDQSWGLFGYTDRYQNALQIDAKLIQEEPGIGVAVVIWRNGKLITNPNGSEGAGGSGGDINQEDGI